MEFTPSDSDLVFRRNPGRYILAGIFAFEVVLFSAIGVYAYFDDPSEFWIIVSVMGAALAFLGGVALWFWTYEARITPYELVVRSAFGSRTVPLTSITRVRRRRVKGNNPPQYNLEVTTTDDVMFRVADMKDGDTWLHERLREKCRGAVLEVVD